MRSICSLFCVGLVLPSRAVRFTCVHRLARDTIQFHDIGDRFTLVARLLSGLIHRLNGNSFLPHASVSVTIASVLKAKYMYVLGIRVLRSVSANVDRLLAPWRLARQLTYSPRDCFLPNCTVLFRGKRGLLVHVQAICPLCKAGVRVFARHIPIPFVRTFSRVGLAGRNERRVTILRVRVVVKAMGIHERRNCMVNSVLRIGTFTRLRPNGLHGDVQFINVFRKEDRWRVFLRKLCNVAEVGTDTSRGRRFLCVVTRALPCRVLLGLRILVGGVNAMGAIHRSTTRVYHYRGSVLKLLFVGGLLRDLPIRRVRFFIEATCRVNVSLLLRVVPCDEPRRSIITYCVCLNYFFRCSTV